MKITERKLKRIIRKTINEMSSPSSNISMYNRQADDMLRDFAKWIRIDEETHDGEDYEGNDHPYMHNFDKIGPGQPTSNAFREEVQSLIDAASAPKQGGTSELGFLLLKLLVDSVLLNDKQSYQMARTIVTALMMCDGNSNRL